MHLVLNLKFKESPPEKHSGLPVKRTVMTTEKMFYQNVLLCAEERYRQGKEKLFMKEVGLVLMVNEG